MQNAELFNLVLGVLSILGIISGYLIEDLRLVFWTVSIPLLIFVVIGYYVIDNRNKLFAISNKMKKIEESLNIYDRLSKLELKVK